MKIEKWLPVLLLSSVVAWSAGCGGGEKGKTGDEAKPGPATPGANTGGSGGDSTFANQPISVYGRNSSSSTYGFFKTVALGDGDYKTSVKEQAGSSAVVQAIGSDKFAIGYSGIGYKTEDVRAVPLAVTADDEAFAPIAENADDYPMARFLLLTVNYQPNSELPPLQREFVKFIFSEEGQDAVKKDNYLPVPAEYAAAQLERVGITVEATDALPAYEVVPGISGTIKSEGSDTMNNMMALWAEGFKKHYPSVEVAIVGKGSSTAIPALVSGNAIFGPMSRKAKQDEIDEFEEKFGYKPIQLGTGVDLLAVYVNKDNPVESLTLPQVDAIFSQNRKLGFEKDITKWGDVGVTE